MKDIQKILFLLVILLNNLFSIDCTTDNGKQWTNVVISTMINEYSFSGKVNSSVRNNQDNTFDVIIDWSTLINESGGFLSDEEIKKFLIAEGFVYVTNTWVYPNPHPNPEVYKEIFIRIHYKTTCYSDVRVALEVQQTYTVDCCDEETKVELLSKIVNIDVNGYLKKIIHTHKIVACGEKCCTKTLKIIWTNVTSLGNGYGPWRLVLDSVNNDDDGCVPYQNLNLGNHCDPPFQQIICTGSNCSNN